MAQDKIKTTIEEFELRLEKLYNIQFETGEIYKVSGNVVSALKSGSMRQRVYYYYLRNVKNGSVAVYYCHERCGVIY